MNDVLVAVAGGSVIGVIAGGIFDLIKMKIGRKYEKEDNRDNFKTAMTEAMQVLLLDRIKYVGQTYIARGCVTFEERMILGKMHESYKGLNGNGDCDILMKEVDELPLKLTTSNPVKEGVCL